MRTLRLWSSSAGFAIVVAMFFLLIISFMCTQMYATGRRMPAYFSSFMIYQEAITAGRMAIDATINRFGTRAATYFSASVPADGYYASAANFNPASLDWDLTGASANKVRTVVQSMNTLFTIRYAVVRMCYQEGDVSLQRCHLRPLGANRYELPIMIPTRITYTLRNTTYNVFHTYFTHFIFVIPAV